MFFEHTKTGYTEYYNEKTAWLWCLLFGPFYWMVRGHWAHVFISFALAMVTAGLSSFVYPIFANRINTAAYAKRGMIPEHPYAYGPFDPNHPNPIAKLKPLTIPTPNGMFVVLIVLGLVFVVLAAKHSSEQSTGGSTLYKLTQQDQK